MNDVALKAAFDHRTIMDGDHVIEVAHIRPAWIARNPVNETDSITFELHKAHIFTEWYDARDTVSRLQCGYPEWVCRSVRFTEDYRARHALTSTEPVFIPLPITIGDVQP